MSVRVVANVSLAEGASAAEVADWLAGCADHTPELLRAHAGVHCSGSVGGGDLTWDLLFETERALASLCGRSGPVPGVGIAAALGRSRPGLVSRIVDTDAVALEPFARHLGCPGLAGVKRTLFLCVREEAPAETRRRFERELPLLAEDVPAIRNWCLSRARATDTGRASPWTHVWEQEFETPAGLEEDYMASPFHWGHVDAFFDPESPQRVAELHLAHLYCPARESVLSW